MSLSLSAWRYLASADLITVQELRAAHIRCLLFDRDNTIVPRSTKRPPAHMLTWLKSLQEAGIVCCMVSNNFHSTQVAASAEELGVEAIDHALKPLPFAVQRALKRMGATPDEAVLVGDQVFTDVLAGNLAGVKTILVRPQSRSDLWYTHILRIFENFFLRNKSFEGE